MHDRTPDFTPWYCPQCEALIPSSGVLTFHRIGMEIHAVGREASNDQPS